MTCTHDHFARSVTGQVNVAAADRAAADVKCALAVGVGGLARRVANEFERVPTDHAAWFFVTPNVVNVIKLWLVLQSNLGSTLRLGAYYTGQVLLYNCICLLTLATVHWKCTFFNKVCH